MAEQVNHNVVNNLESTGGSPLVDVAANQTTTEFAGNGSNEQSTFDPKTSALPSSDTASQYANETTAITLGGDEGIQEAATTIEPSAGDVAGNAANTELTTNFPPDATDVSTPAQELVNGLSYPVGNEEAVSDEIAAQDGSLDASLNSDTEGSRGDATDAKKDGELNHVRSNSVKKPTTFSRVSVTKSYLAKSSTPPIPKPGDKPSPAGTPSNVLGAKPRLIAKTGASLRDVQKARLGAEITGAPDASKVWNKNRPVPAPPPKHFTDEELKQQYGIHLATRLQADGEGKESKWADIDDDEDDWAPEAVVWMDGTKSTLTPAEATSAQKELKVIAPQPQKDVVGTKPTLAVKKPTEIGPVKTILKPGASAAAAQARQSESGTGTPTDKAALAKSRSPAPTPAKSPWAALPPVDKMSPINPPVQQVQQQPPPFVSQDARAYEPAPPSQPAREIAADTFDRQWREGEGGTRELFNSANGRYEAAPEVRRGSMKPDSAYRKPAVLQRSSQSGAGPAEPSAAFQTRTASQVDGSHGRRRGSSVSQGSLPSGRRPSVSVESPVLSERRTSTVIGHDMRTATSPRAARNEPVQPSRFSQQTAWDQQMPQQPPAGAEQPAEDGQDIVKAQERIMKEKRELAKKRREEEEQRLEAEKQERLAARLANLAGAGKSRKEREAEAEAALAAAAVVAPTPSLEKPQDAILPTPVVDEIQPEKAEPAELASIAAPALEAQVPLTEPEATQPSPEESIPSPLPPKAPVVSLPERPVSSTDQQTQRQAPRQHLSPRANARLPFQQQQQAPYRPSPSTYSSPGDRKQQPFGRSPMQTNDTFAQWPAAHNSSVWGTNAGIGNGTFESTNAFAPLSMSQQSSILPPPGMTGMTRPPTSTRISPQSMNAESRPSSLQQQSIAEPPRGMVPPGFEARADALGVQGRMNGGSPAGGIGRQTQLPAPIGPPSRSQQQQQQPVQRPDSLAAWNNAAHRLPHQYKAEAEAAERKRREALPSAPREDTLKETFKQTATDQGRLGAPRRYDNTQFTVHDAQGSRSVQSHSPAPPATQTQPSGPFSTASPVQYNAWKQMPENTVRMPDGSLNPAHGGAPAQLPPIAPPTSQQVPVPSYEGARPESIVAVQAVDAREPSPPPPETSAHPVHSGSSNHPLVRLPVKPRVRLPPSQVSSQQQTMQQPAVMMPLRPISNHGIPAMARPIAAGESWQARFNGLFGRAPVQTETPPSPPKTPPKMPGLASPVTSTSRTAITEDTLATPVATVSLPQVKKLTSPEGLTIDESSDVSSKRMIEQMFTEERGFGSLPKVALPRNAGYNAGYYEPARYNMQKGSAAPEVQARVGLNMFEIHPRRHDGIYISLPGLKQRLARYPQHGNRNASGSQQERKPSAKFVKAKGKEPWINGVPNKDAGSNISQKASAPATKASAPAETVSPAPATDAGAPKRTAWPKPPRGPRNHHHRPAPVKSA